MPRFVANPITVSAEQFLGDVAQWPEPFRLALLRHLPGGITEIRTDDGPRPCRVTDWVVHGPEGFRVVHEAAFEQMYQERAPFEADSSPDPEASAKRPPRR